MKEIKVVLYGEPTNNAVLRLPDRRYPGVLIQGDTLKNLVDTSQEVAKLARGKSGGELADEAEGLANLLREIYEWYLRETTA